MQDPSFARRQATLLAALRFLFPDCVKGTPSETGELDIKPIRNDQEALTILSNELRFRRFPALTAPVSEPEKVPLEAYRMSPEPIGIELLGFDGALGLSLDRVGGLVGLVVQKDIILRQISESEEQYQERKAWWFREGHRWRPAETKPIKSLSMFARVVERIGRIVRGEFSSTTGAPDAAENL